MCTPALPAIPLWVQWVGTAASLASGVMSAVGQYQQGQSQKAQAEYQATISRNNAIAAGYAADDAVARGKIAADRQALKGRLLLGSMRAAMAANGQIVDQDTALDLTSDQAGENKLEELNIQSNADREAYKYRIQASNYEDTARLYEFQGENAASAGITGAAGSLLSSVGKVASKWYDFRDPAPAAGTRSNFELYHAGEIGW